MDERLLRRLAERQHGVVSIAQLRRLGLGYNGASARVGSGRLVRVHHGVYAVGRGRLGVRGRWMAAVLAFAPGAVLSHASAAALHDLRGIPSGPIDVSTGRRSVDGRPGIRLHRPRVFEATDLTEVDGIPVTTLARTIVDVAAILPSAALERLIHEADVRRVLDMAAVDACANRLGAPRGITRLRAALLDSQAGALRSDLEERFATLIATAGLPRPLRNVNLDIGGHLIEVDALWPAPRVVVELDGRATHDTRRAFERDRRRDGDLQAAGYRVLRFTRRRLLEDAHGALGTLTRLLAGAP